MVTAQNTNFWNINGNATSNGNFLGTKNNEPLVFKTNGSEAMRIKPNGEVKIATFENLGKGVVTFNNNGVLTTRIFPNDTNQVFCGSGNFKSVAALSGWTRTGNVLYNAPGVNVGIGTNNPQYALDVVGSANFTGTISAQGVILTNKLLADTMQAGSMFALNNRLHMNAGGTSEIYTSMGDLRLQCNVSNPTNTIFSAGTSGNVGIGTFNPQYKLDVTGATRFNGDVYVGRVRALPGDSIIRFGDSTIAIYTNTNRITWTPYLGFRGLGIGQNAYAYGDQSVAIGKKVLNSATAINSVTIGTGPTNGGYFINTIANSFAVGFQSNIPTFFVGAASGNNTVGNVGIGTDQPNAKLQIGSDYRGMALGTADGMAVSGFYGSSYLAFNVVRLPTNMWVAKSDFAHNGGIVMLADINGGFRISQLPTDEPGTTDKQWTSQEVVDHSIFQIRSDGKIVMGKEQITGGPLDNSAIRLTVDGGIACKKLNVTLNNWADSVLAPGYYLMPLDSVSSFIQINGHLPNVPSEQDVKANGTDLAQTDVILLAKVEELTLYMIQMQKRIAELEVQNQKLLEEKGRSK